MPPISPKSGSNKPRSKPRVLTSLTRAFAQIQSERECVRVLADLCTPSEIRALQERWAIAQWLDGSDQAYRNIAAHLGASVTTVGRVARFLREEPHGGYRLLLDRQSKPRPLAKKTTKKQLKK